MKKRILLPTDFSKNSWHAIRYAVEILKEEQIDFFIVNVFSGGSDTIQNMIGMEPGSQLYEIAKSESEEGLAKVLDMIVLNNKKNNKHNFKTISTFNSPLEAIKNLVVNKDIDLVVMGTRGKTDSKKTVYGSTAINVMEKVRDCPILVIPDKTAHSMPKEIVFPTNFKLNIRKKELEFLTHIAQQFKATIQVLHIEEEQLTQQQKNNKELLHQYFKDVDHVFRTLSAMPVAMGINCFVESRESDMIAFINKKHFLFGSILTRPLVKELGYDSKVPLLVMHYKDH